MIMALESHLCWVGGGDGGGGGGGGGVVVVNLCLKVCSSAKWEVCLPVKCELYPRRILGVAWRWSCSTTLSTHLR